MIPPRQSCKDRLHPGAFPNWCREGELNTRRVAFRTTALPLSYPGVNWCGYGESNPGCKCGTLADCRNLSSALLVGKAGLEPAKDAMPSVLQTEPFAARVTSSLLVAQAGFEHRVYSV